MELPATRDLVLDAVLQYYYLHSIDQKQFYEVINESSMYTEQILELISKINAISDLRNYTEWKPISYQIREMTLTVGLWI